MSFEADMEALGMEGTPAGTLAGTPAGSEATPVAGGTPLKALGREYKSPDELVRAHESLYKDYTKKSQRVSQLEEWDQFEKYLTQHPELKNSLSKAILDYQSRVRGGQSPQAAQAATGLDPKVASQVETIQNQLDDMALEKEISEVRTRYNLDEQAMQKVLREAQENDGIPLDKAYRIVMADDAIQKQRALEAAQRQSKAAAVQSANVGGSNTGNFSASPKDPGKMSESEARQRASNILESFGIKD